MSTYPTRPYRWGEPVRELIPISEMQRRLAEADEEDRRRICRICKGPIGDPCRSVGNDEENEEREER